MNKIKHIISEYEHLCIIGQAQSMEANCLLSAMENWFENSIYEFCAHNAALLGFRRYEQYKFEGIDHLVTKDEYEELTKENVR